MLSQPEHSPGIDDGGIAMESVQTLSESQELAEQDGAKLRWNATGIRERLRTWRYTSPLIAFYGVHIAMTVFMLVITLYHHKHIGSVLTEWDGRWYEQIARHGYSWHLTYNVDGSLGYSNLAFFPLLPLLMRAMTVVTDLKVEYTGILISWICAAFAATGIYTLLSRYVSKRAALLAVVLWAVVPPSYVESMDYTETMFTAFAVWALYALVQKKWLTSAILIFFAGLTHSTVVILVAVLAIAALVEIHQRRGDGLRALWRPAASILIAPSGFLVFLLYLWKHTGLWNAWFLAEQGGSWKANFDFGDQALSTLWRQFLWRDIDGIHFVPYLLATAVIVPAIVCNISLLRRRLLPWEILLWTTMSVIFTMGSAGVYSSKPRFLLPIFPLLVPFAQELARRPRKTQIVAIAMLVIFGAWFGGYFLTYKFGPP
jgi:Gpi18-like mannosyltransferase